MSADKFAFVCCRYVTQRPASDAHLFGRIAELTLEHGFLVTATFDNCGTMKSSMLIINSSTGCIYQWTNDKTQTMS